MNKEISKYTKITNNNCSIKLSFFSDFFPMNKSDEPTIKELIRVITYELMLKK